MTIESLLSGAKPIWSMLGQLIAGYENERNTLFEKHVEPLHKRLLIIHDDYIKGIHEIKKFAEDNKTTETDIVGFIELRRRMFEAERNLASHIAKQLSEAERRIVRTDAWDTILKYCHSIDIYLSRPYTLYAKSAYRGILEIARSKNSMDEFMHFETFITVHIDTEWKKQVIIVICDNLLNELLPEALSKINENYSVLRVKLQ